MARLMDIYNKKKAGKGKDGGDGPKLPEPAVDAAQAAAQKGTSPPLQSKHEMDLLTAECSERRAFEAERKAVLEGTAPRLYLGTVLTREALIQAGSGPEAGEIAGVSNLEGFTPYIINFARRPKQTKGHLSVVGGKAGKSHEDEVHANFYSKVFEALELVKSYALPPGTGPFADVDGVVKAYADALFRGGVPDKEAAALLDKIERVIDARPNGGSAYESMEPRLFQGHTHVFNAGVETPDDPINASLIMSSPSRIFQDEVSNAVSLSISHPWEPYIIGVAALRSRGIPAYLGQALVPYTVGDPVPDYLERDSLLYKTGKQAALATPIIAIIDPNADAAMRVFRMSRLFPPIGAIDILSDTAAEGAAFAIRAEMRVKHLAFEMIRRPQLKQAPLNESEYKLALERIARCLFQSVKRWDGNPLVSRVLGGVEGGVQEGVFMFALAKFGEVNDVDLTTRAANIMREILAKFDEPEMFAPQDELQAEARKLAVFVKASAKEAAKTVQAVLGRWLIEADENKKNA